MERLGTNKYFAVVLGIMEGLNRGGYFLDSIFYPLVVECINHPSLCRDVDLVVVVGAPSTEWKLAQQVAK